MKRTVLALITVLFISGCGGGGGGTSSAGFTDVSAGLTEGVQWRESIALFDLDGDGLKDIIAPPPRPTRASPKVFLNKGVRWEEITETCSFPPEVDFYGWVEADPSGNLYFALHGIGAYALRRTGPCSWENPSTGLPPRWAFPTRALAIGDINADGHTDIAALSDEYYALPTTIRVFLGDGNFRWVEASEGLPLQISGDHISLTDVNADGFPDIIADNTNQSENGVVWLGDGGRTWRRASEGLPEGLYASTYPVRGGFVSMFFGDAFDGGPFVFKLKDGIWGIVPSTGLPCSWDITAITASDINGDGKEDLILGDGREKTLRVFSGLGNHAFAETLSLPLPSGQGSAWNLRAEDINGDGRPDIAVNMASADGKGALRVFVQK